MSWCQSWFYSPLLETLSLPPPLHQEEPEDFIATQWYKAAANASNPAEQLKAYQSAIQTLQVPDTYSFNKEKNTQGLTMLLV